MPARRDRILEDALAALAAALDEAGARWMVIGGIAVIAHGVRRFTTDIDAAVLGPAIPIADLVRVLAKHAIAPRVADAAAFAEAHLVILLRHVPTGVDLDVSLAWSAFEQEALGACAKHRFGRVRVPMASPEDLVVFKAIAGRPRDMDDVEALLVLHPSVDVVRARRRVAELAELADAPALVQGFDAVARRARGGPDVTSAGSPAKRAVPRPRTRRRT